MSEPELTPDELLSLQERVREAVETLQPEIDSLLAEGQTVLTGPATVSLALGVEGALTPQEAVDIMIRNLIYRGANSFVWAVTDELTGEDYFVREGEILDEDAVEELGTLGQGAEESTTFSEVMSHYLSLDDDDDDEDEDEEPPVAPPVKKAPAKKATKKATKAPAKKAAAKKTTKKAAPKDEQQT